MEPRFTTMDQMHVIGVELRTTAENGKSAKEIPVFWYTFIKDKVLDRIPNKVNEQVTLGICTDLDDKGYFSYIIAAIVENLDNIPEGMTGRTIPSTDYAVFTSKGEFTNIPKTYQYVYTSWLGNSGYVHAMGPEFEWYDERSCPDRGDNAEVDIYIPVKAK